MTSIFTKGLKGPKPGFFETRIPDFKAELAANKNYTLPWKLNSTTRPGYLIDLSVTFQLMNTGIFSLQEKVVDVNNGCSCAGCFSEYQLKRFFQKLFILPINFSCYRL